MSDWTPPTIGSGWINSRGKTLKVTKVTTNLIWYRYDGRDVDLWRDLSDFRNSFKAVKPLPRHELEDKNYPDPVTVGSVWKRKGGDEMVTVISVGSYLTVKGQDGSIANPLSTELQQYYEPVTIPTAISTATHDFTDKYLPDFCCKCGVFSKVVADHHVTCSPKSRDEVIAGREKQIIACMATENKKVRESTAPELIPGHKDNISPIGRFRWDMMGGTVTRPRKA
ncbi:hypothetical protein UFOVP276_232 [uncultured Caudovirales phage]|uniref:Uncharacterized protein n=1 Tax=uncultured Caudovirales phage TaxID=2100421 RepID=A0A6J5LQT1_9CAUD|nr:hypothetical protein UFOVP127_126 [uncultured Caudovirales phage]CAB4135276.1 hypothetical protein UFOVP276_232 [uncultured Caudovirales phage]